MKRHRKKHKRQGRFCIGKKWIDAKADLTASAFFLYMGKQKRLSLAKETAVQHKCQKAPPVKGTPTQRI